MSHSSVCQGFVSDDSEGTLKEEHYDQDPATDEISGAKGEISKISFDDLVESFPDVRLPFTEE